MAGPPKELIENPGDVLSDVLRTIRLSGTLQFCFMPSGSWQTGGGPSLARAVGNQSGLIPFHVMVEGSCWIEVNGRQTVLLEGDVVAFPFGTEHELGAGDGGRMISPMSDLPPRPWRELPILRYGNEASGARLLCGYVTCDAVSFRPLRTALPQLLHVRTRGNDGVAWLRSAIAQIAAETDQPRAGSLSMLERLTEIIFIELLRYQIIAAKPDTVGWLAALADPALGRCLALIHNDPGREWSVQTLSAASGLSRSTLTERFETILDTSPMRYVRDWRLCLASMALNASNKSIAAIAHDAGYGTEAAFSRAFARAYGAPPAAWRQQARRSQGNAA